MAAVEARRHRRQRTRIIRNTAIGAGAVIALAVAFFSLGGSDGGRDLSGVATAEGWDLPALEGEERIALADFEGKPTVAVFFASWCEVCEREIPGFAILSDQLGSRVNWVGINSQDNGRGRGDAEKWGIDTRWPLARDIGGVSQADLSTGVFGMRGMPLTVLYDEAGTVVHVQRGGISAEDLLTLLDQAFGVAAA